MEAKKCVFCQLSNTEQGNKIYEDDTMSVVLDIRPVNPGQVLIIPKKHYSTLLAMPNKELSKMIFVAKAMGSIMFEALGAEGVNLLASIGPAAGQKVGHAFMYVIPRYKGDKAGLVLNQKEVSQEELKEAFEKMAKTLSGKTTKQEGAPEPKPKKEPEEKPEPKPKPPIPPPKPKPRIP